MWKLITAEFDGKGWMAHVDLRRKMMEKCVEESDDICAHLDDMAFMHEQLSGMGAKIDDEDYASMILMSLPLLYTISKLWLAGANQYKASNFIAKRRH